MIAFIFFSGFIISFICNELLLRFSQSLGIRNKNDVIIRWSNQSKPSLGGVSFFVVFIFGTIGFIMLQDGDNIFHNVRDGYAFTGLFLSSCLAFLMGLADDAYNTKPYFKLFIQISCGILIAATGTIIDLTHLFYLDAFMTVVWVIIVMNSLNMLDNMDGITGTTVVFILLSCLFGGWIWNGFNDDVWTISILSMLGAVIGFLRFNIHPSRIFMGDAGSQFIGLFVAFFAIKFLWNIGPITENHSWTGLLITLVAFTPTAADTLTVVLNRLKRGQSPMVGGKDHTTHHLVYAGLNDRQVWYVFTAIGFLSTIFAIAMIRLVEKDLIIFASFFVLYFVLVFAFLYRNTLKFPEPKH